MTCIDARGFSDNAWKWHPKAVYNFLIIGMQRNRRIISTNLSSHWYQFWLLGAAWISAPCVRGLGALPTQLMERKTRRGFPRCWVTTVSPSCQRRNLRAPSWNSALLASGWSPPLANRSHRVQGKKLSGVFSCLFFLSSALRNVADF